ncbi:anti-sigma factor [Variovorax sp. YR752]|uniref:anti-sigma factor n=1 Tax=Variovorax sp. YR752 TaxID=1884383 RepID=UPI0031382A06
MDYGRPELADRLAAAYVAGTLRGPARRRFESLLPAHPMLRRAVRAWQERLMPLTVGIAPEQPSPQVWQLIEARIGGAPTGVAAPLPWWAQLAFWRGFAALASVATISLAVLLASPAPVQPPIVVVLNATAPGGEGGVIPASFVASISGDGRTVVARPIANVALQNDRVLELWAAAGKNPPRSLGLISARGATVVKRTSLPPGTDHLAVSLEPPGGSPTGAPTGPVLAVGNL